MENTKICKKCGRELPLSEFNKCKRAKDELQPYCKVCMKQYYTANREHMLERQKQYNAKHAEAIKQYMKQWRADNPEYMKQYMKQWEAEHKEERTEYFKQYNAEHAEEKAEYNKQHYATIEGYAYMVRYHNLQADREQGRCGKDEDPLPTIEQYIELLQQRDYYDKKHYPFNEMGVDRIDNSKAHTIDNIVPCSTAHNVQRGRKTFEEFKEYFKQFN